jgi:uncharacterized protein involved in exopolysaccharide biosynthesis
MSFQDYGLIFRRRKWVILLGVILGSGAGAALNHVTEPVYRATARIEIQREPNRSLLTGEVTQNPSFQTENVSLFTAAETIVSRGMLERVVAALRDRPGMMSDAVRTQGIDRQVDWLAARVNVEPVRDTRLVNIHAEHGNPRCAATIADSVARFFAESHSRQREAGAGSLVRFLEQQLDQIKQKIEESERWLVNGQQGDPFTLEKRLEQLTLTMGELQRKLATSNSELARARQIYKELHPKYISLDQENATVRAEITAAEHEMRRINDTLQRYSLVQSELKGNRELHGMLLVKLKEAQINGQMQSDLVQIEQAAAVPVAPIRPKKAMNLAVCLMAGILAGIGLAFLLEHLRHTIRTPDQVAEHLELPVLGLIPKVAKP